MLFLLLLLAFPPSCQPLGICPSTSRSRTDLHYTAANDGLLSHSLRCARCIQGCPRPVVSCLVHLPASVFRLSPRNGADHCIPNQPLKTVSFVFDARVCRTQSACIGAVTPGCYRSPPPLARPPPRARRPPACAPWPRRTGGAGVTPATSPASHRIASSPRVRKVLAYFPDLYVRSLEPVCLLHNRYVPVSRPGDGSK